MYLSRLMLKWLFHHIVTMSEIQPPAPVHTRLLSKTLRRQLDFAWLHPAQDNAIS
jgi:hypothetical protein